MEQNLFEQLTELLNGAALPGLRAALLEMNVVDIARFFEELETREQILLVFRLLSKDQSADVFSYLDTEHQQTIIESISDKELNGIVSDLFIDDAVDILEELPANVVKRVLRNTDEQTRKVINEFLKYPEQSAGSIMTIEYVDLREEYTAEEALNRIRHTGVDKETIYTCYVTDSRKKLRGILALHKLLMADDKTLIRDVMDENIQFAHTLDDQESVIGIMREYDLLAIPIVDNEDRLVGIVTVDDALDVQEEEATEDFELMAAVLPSETPYLRTGVLLMAKNRAPWLLILMLTATITATIINAFEDALAVLPALVAFIPMLMDTGGNAGCQTSTLVIRGMAVGDIELSDILRVVWKELRVSLLCGSMLVAVNLVRILIFQRQSLYLIITISLTLYATVIMAKTIGCTLPMVAKKLRLDPAVMASPVITSIVDAGALLVYFTLAKTIIGI